MYCHNTCAAGVPMFLRKKTLGSMILANFLQNAKHWANDASYDVNRPPLLTYDCNLRAGGLIPKGPQLHVWFFVGQIGWEFNGLMVDLPKSYRKAVEVIKCLEIFLSYNWLLPIDGKKSRIKMPPPYTLELGEIVKFKIMTRLTCNSV